MDLIGQFQNFFSSNFEKVPDFVGLLVTLGTLFLLAISYIRRAWLKESKRFIGSAFRETVEGLSSDRKEIRIASAIILRRFLDKHSEFGIGGAPFRHEAISVAISLLKNADTDDVQKLLCEIIRVSEPEWLKDLDLQNANLSNAYLADMEIRSGDFFQSKIESASFSRARIPNGQFREAIIRKTSFKGADIRNSNFTSAVLEDVDFTDANVEGVVFERTVMRRVKGLVDQDNANLQNVAYVAGKPVGQEQSEQTLKVFLSRPSRMNAEQDIVFRLVRSVFVARGIIAVELPPKDYASLGALNKILELLGTCQAMVTFGFCTYTINQGAYRQFDREGRELRDVKLASPWCQLEAGMALTQNMQVLAIAEAGIEEGIFDPKIADSHVSLLQADSSSDLFNFVNTWIDENLMTAKPQ